MGSLEVPPTKGLTSISRVTENPFYDEVGPLIGRNADSRDGSTIPSLGPLPLVLLYHGAGGSLHYGPKVVGESCCHSHARFSST